MRRVSKPVRALAFGGRLAASAVLFTNHALALSGDVKLPPPYVSRALDAVLLPINGEVRKAFTLNKEDKGVLVLSVEPNGTAAKSGIMPGDVLSDIKGHKIKKPIDVDSVVYYWAKKGQFDFPIDYYRDGVAAHGGGTITLDEYSTAIDLVAIASWASWSIATSFSYSEFYSEYSAEFSASYESSETLIEENASSEEFSTEVNNESEDSDKDGVPNGIDDDDDNDGTPDATDTDDDNDGTLDADDADHADDGAGDDGGDDSAGDDGGNDDGGGDSGGDDGGGDDGGDE